MSGIAGVAVEGGAPVDRALLGRMAGHLSARGPDGGRVLHLGSCGFAHSLLLTGDRPPPAGPLSLAPSLSIVCDARLDAPAELARALAAAGDEAPAGASAAELVLRAYRAWGPACVDRLPGDFAFAVWDGAARRLFCARDPFGVKQLYHASPPGAFVFSNSLECVLLHPGVDPALDETAVADFLLHSVQLDRDRTVRRAVRALPPGHALAVEEGRVRAWRWWHPPADEPLRYRRVGDYAEHFREVFSAAVRARMPEGPVSVLMSGGRDSPAVAAVAGEAAPGRVRAFTAFSSGLVREEEGRYAEIAARALGISVTWLDVDPYRAFGRFGCDPLLRRPEPLDAPFLAAEADQSLQAAGHARVLLTGFGGDAAQRESASRLTRLALAGHPLRAAAEAARYARLHRRLPRPGVRTWLRRGEPPAPRRVPPWIAEGFARRVRLAERLAPPDPVFPPHPLRPEAVEALAGPLWPALFAAHDPGATGVPLEVRHPFLDLRLIRFLLSVPPAQWYNDKGLLVAAMRGRLPDAVLRRPKAPLPDDPLAARLRAHGAGWLDGRTLGREVESYVDPERVPALTGGRAPGPGDPLWLNVRPLALSLWLREHAAAPSGC